jgi:hypothetical protein
MGSQAAKVLIFMGLIAGIIACVPSAQAQQTPPPNDGCIAYAYTTEPQTNHYSLLASNSMVFGTSMNVVSNCGNFSISSDGMIMMAGYNSGSLRLEGGLTNITFQSDGYEVTYSNVTVVEAGILQDALWGLPALSNPYAERFSPSDIIDKELIASIGTGILVWAIVTLLMWPIVDSITDRRMIEEITR